MPENTATSELSVSEQRAVNYSIRSSIDLYRRYIATVKDYTAADRRKRTIIVKRLADLKSAVKKLNG